MIQFPSATAVGRIMPKEVFYKRLPISAELKEKFVTDVKRITLANSLTTTTLNLKPGMEISEILVLVIDLKKQEFDGRIIEIIARQNKHQLVFLLRNESNAKLAVYYRKLYTTEWKPIDDLKLVATGFTLDDVWCGFLEQIALQKDIVTYDNNGDIDEKLARQETILKLQKDIDKLEKLTRSEKQPKKKFELYQQMQKLEKELEDTKHGKE